MRYHEQVSDSAQPLIIPLSDAHAELSQVGEHYRFLAHLISRGVPIGPWYILTPLYLARLAEFNALGETLRHFLPSTTLIEHNRGQRVWEVASQQIQTKITQFQYPPDLGQELLTAYVRWWEDVPVDIAVVDPHHSQARPQVIEPLVTGESNISLAVLNAWSQWYAPGQLKRRVEEMKGSRFAYPVIAVRPRPAIQVSGQAFTTHPQLDHKGRILISAHWGETPPSDQPLASDRFEVDVRNYQVVQRQVVIKPEQWMIKNGQLTSKAVAKTQQSLPCISDEHLSQLATFCQQTKHATVHHIQLDWQLTKHGLEIKDVNQIRDQAELHMQSPARTSPPTLALGHVLIKGYVTNQTQVLRKPNEIASLPPGRIVVIPELSIEWLPALHKAAALVCEGGVQSPALLQTLKEYNVPTLIQVKQATTLLAKAPIVTVNALKGSIHLATPTQLVAAHAYQPSHGGATSQLTVKPKSPHPEYHHYLPTLTKVLVAASSIHQTREFSQPGVDGVSLLKSEYTMAQFGSHPLHVLKTADRDKLKQALLRFIQNYAHPLADYPILYRSQNFTSGELQQLQHSTPYEQTEPNPLLGFRGGIRLLHTRELLAFELEILFEAAQRTQRGVGYLLPYVRTPAEFKLLKKAVDEYYGHHHAGYHQPVWLQINTPANLEHISEFLEDGVAGLTLNVKTLFALWYGIDPDNPDVYALYSFDPRLIRHTLQGVRDVINRYQKNTGQTVPLILHLEEARNELITLAAELNIAGVIVKPNFAKTAKQLIIEVQHAQLHLE